MRRVDLNEVGADQDNYLIHLARYMFCARQLSKEMRVLEIGCGTGYGSRLIADYCKQIDAYDLNHKELKDSWTAFNKENLFFYEYVPTIKYDVVISYEVVEHINENELDIYFQQIKESLNENGVLYISTPRFLPMDQRSENRRIHHKYEYKYSEFKQLLEKHFKNIFIFSQNDTHISTQNFNMAWNFLAICLNKK